MSQLKIFNDHDPKRCLLMTKNIENITQELTKVGI